jgi:hypothetical protein
MATEAQVSWARFMAHAEWVLKTVERDGEPELTRDFKDEKRTEADGSYSAYALDADATEAQEAEFDKIMQKYMDELD